MNAIIDPNFKAFGLKSILKSVNVIFIFMAVADEYMSHAGGYPIQMKLYSHCLHERRKDSGFYENHRNQNLSHADYTDKKEKHGFPFFFFRENP